MLQADTEILQWPQGKKACVSLTYDDGSINHFKMAVPMMEKRDFEGTFFINTQRIEGSEYYPKFVGRPIMDILEECKNTPTNKNNILERSSLIRYLADIQEVPALEEVNMYEIGDNLEHGNMDEAIKLVDEACQKLIETGKEYAVKSGFDSDRETTISWEKLSEVAKKGHEFGNHTISHPYLSTLNKENLEYEINKCMEDIKNHLGKKHTLSIECPYGIEDPRVLDYVYPRYPFPRNRVKDSFIKEILRGDTTEPVSKEKPYIHWQRGPLSDTSLDTMKSWVDKSLKNNVWLVLVFHGIEGVGWEAIPKERISSYFDYIKNRDIWVATYQDAYKYIREKMKTTIKEKREEDKIIINIDNDLDKQVYNYPLTLETEIPEEWQKVEVVKGKDKEQINKSSADKVIYQVDPAPKSVIIRKCTER